MQNINATFFKVGCNRKFTSQNIARKHGNQQRVGQFRLSNFAVDGNPRDQKLHQRKKNAGTLYPDSPKESFSFRIFQRKGLEVLDSFLLSLKFEVAFHQIIAKTFYNSEELIMQSKPLERKFHPNVPLGTPGYSSLDRENNSALVIILFEIHDNTWPQLRLRNNARWSYDVMIFTHA